MAQTGYTPILIYSSSTVSQAPSASNLTNSTLGSELAINITDGKLFYKDNANAVQVIGWKTVPTTAGGTGLTSYTAGDLIYYATGTTFTKLGIGTAYQALQVNAGGTAPSWQASATSTLTAQGDLLYASAANTLARLAKNTTATRYLANTGSSNNPSWDQVNLANGVTGTLPVANGGTNATATPTAGGVSYGTGSAYAFTSAGTTNQLLQSAGSSAPTWTSAINGVSIGQTTRAAGAFTEALINTATNTHSSKLVVDGDFTQLAKRWGYRGANGVSAGTTGTYTVDLTGFPGAGSGGTNELITFYWVTFFSGGSGHQVQGAALYTNNYNGDALLIATIGSAAIAGSITFSTSGASPRVTITNSSGSTPTYTWFTIGM